MKDSAPITFNIEPHAITLLSEMGVVQEQEGGERLPPPLAWFEEKLM